MPWRASLIFGLLLLLPAAPAPAAFKAKVRHTRAGGTTIAWYERGRTTGPPLVMAIGTGSTMAEWDPALIELLAQKRRLILFDYPGLGRSGPQRGTVTFPRYADALASFLSAIKVEQADVLGWSMGGFVAQQLAIRHPTRVNRLVLAGTNPGGDLAQLGSKRAQDIDSDPNPTDAEVLKVLYPDTRAGQKEGRRFVRRLEHAARTGEIPDDFDVPDKTVDAQVRAEDPWLRSDANAQALTTIRAPTLVTGGAQDPVTPPINMRRIAQRIPGARLELFPNSAHAFLFQERARFARTVSRFLSEPPPARATRPGRRPAR
jgi:pimeloyl-ACP methyl ester carboxylesterase